MPRAVSVYSLRRGRLCPGIIALHSSESGASGHGELPGLIGRLSVDRARCLAEHPCSWQRTQEVLDFFCDNTESAQQQYVAFVADGLIGSGSMDFDGGGIARSLAEAGQLVELRDEKNRRLGDERILGSSDFVDDVLSTSGRKFFAVYRG